MSSVNFDIERFFDTSRNALVASSRYIHGAIVGDVDLSEFFIKGDRTAVTVVDTGSQELGMPILEEGLADFGIVPEEGKGRFGNSESNTRVGYDPLDGTGGFLLGGPTPTVISHAYDRLGKGVLAVSTMEPVTGRFWFSATGEGAWMNRLDYSSGKWVHDGRGRKLNVNGHGISDPGAHVLVDVTHPFSRPMGDGSTRPVLYRQGRRVLTNEIETAGAKEASFYTNGGHYALVATGRPTLVGCITTAIGGPFDVAGLLHVEEAMGAAQCYGIETEGNSRVLHGLGQDIEAADIVIAANGAKNLETLENAVRKAVSYKE
jgi:hypothetical protein